MTTATKPLGARQQRRLIELITGVYESATLKNAAFDSICGTPEDGPLPRSEREVTNFIRKRVDLHHRSWILSPLQEALEILTSKGDDRQ